MPKKLSKLREVARMLFRDSKLTIKQIAYYLSRADSTIYRWQEVDKWGSGVEVSLDKALVGFQQSLLLALEALKTKSLVNETFDDLDYSQMVTVIWRMAITSESLSKQAPFIDAKLSMEAVEKFEKWIVEQEAASREDKEKKSIILTAINDYREETHKHALNLPVSEEQSQESNPS